MRRRCNLTLSLLCFLTNTVSDTSNIARPTTRFYLPGKDPPLAKDLSIVEKLLSLQLEMVRTSVASKTSATSTSTLMETRLPVMVKSRQRAEMYGTEPSHCKRR
ncbi:hypothetical protein NE237_018633 [Protea cynaroides]|uniref:Secreted protein n=1 Tax=Protea cynaroides TaxID=273540 RepID=A0A9Q0KAB8_9MAGN|nr:hypothetical protein NE237_018633 [Protea cynaroides]